MRLCFNQAKASPHFYPCLPHLCSPLPLWLTPECFQVSHCLCQEVFLDFPSKLSPLVSMLFWASPYLALISLQFYSCIFLLIFLCFLFGCRVCVFFSLRSEGSSRSLAHCRCLMNTWGAVTCLRSSTQSKRAAILIQILFRQVKCCMEKKNIQEATLQGW